MLSDKYGPWAVIAGGSEGVGAQQCRRLGVEAVTVATDHADPAAVETLAAATRDREVGPVHIAGGNDADVARRNDPDRAKVVAGAHRFMQKLMGHT